MCMKNMLY